MQNNHILKYLYLPETPGAIPRIKQQIGSTGITLLDILKKEGFTKTITFHVGTVTYKKRILDIPEITPVLIKNIFERYTTGFHVGL